MNIACDARALVGPTTGVGTWTAQIMGGLARVPGWEVLLAASRPLTLPPELARATVLAPPRLSVPGTLWLHTALPRALEHAGADVFVAALAVVPRRCPVPAVAVVHDLTPRSHPHRHTLANRFCFNAYVEESLERARAVVAVSAATAQDVTMTFPRLRGRVRTICNGVDPFFSPAPQDADGAAVRERFSGGRPFLLHLGTLEPRKGLVTLVDAWEDVAEKDAATPDLVLAGAPGWDRGALVRRVAASPRRARIHLPGYVSRDDARSLLRHAAAFVLASEAEGFGLPLAEALCCGAPCVASDIPAAREVAGDAALFALPCDAAALADALREVLVPAAADELRRRAAVRAADLGWEPAVAAWRTLLEEIVGERSDN